MQVRASLHGRDALLSTLVDGLETSGRVLLAGDAGVGKTVLVEAALDVLHGLDDDRRDLVGRCVGESAGTLPYLPFIEAFGRLDAVDPAAVDHLVDAFPGITRLVPRRRAGEDDIDRGRIVESVHGGLELLARRGPVLLVLEDIHWADESTRELLTLLFTRGFVGRVSVLASYRSDDLHRRHPLRSSLTVWSRIPGVRRLHVPPLDDDAMTALVRDAGPDLDADAVVRVVERAGGNAFFAEELIAAGSGWGDDLGRLLVGRLDGLGEDTQDLVRLMAVLGRSVDHVVLAAVAGRDDVVLDRALREAVDRQILEPTRDGGYAFRHALLAEAVYDDLLPGERWRHHRACVDVLRSRPDLAGPAELARHALAVDDTALAVDASIAAAAASRRLGGPAEALRHLENALRLLDEGDPRRHRVTVDAVVVALASGRVNAASSLLRTRLRHDDLPAAERAELLARLAGTMRFSDGEPDALAVVDEGLALLPPTGEDDLRADLATRRVEALWDAGRREEAVVEAETLLTRGVVDRDRVLRADVEAVLARAWVGRAGEQDPLSALENLIARWGEEIDTSLLHARYRLAQVHFREGRIRDALQVHLRTVDLAARAGLQASPFAVFARALVVLCAYEVGEWRSAQDAVAGAAELPGEMQAAVDAAGSLLLAGRGSEEAPRAFERLRSWWDFDRSIAVQTGVAAVDTYGWAGDVDSARRVRQEVVDYLRRAGNQKQALVEVRLNALLLGHLAAAVRERGGLDPAAVAREGEVLVSEALSVWDEEPSHPPRTLEADAWEARVRAEHGYLRWRLRQESDPAALIADFTNAGELFARKGDVYEEARCSARVVELFTATGCREQAQEARRAVLDLAHRLGATPLAALVGADDREAGASSGRRPASPELTSRERDVLALVAEGRTNGEIGTALFITTKTVSVHVSNILAKLGVVNRGQAAAVARERGLV